MGVWQAETLKGAGHNIIGAQAGRVNLEMEACAIVYVLRIPTKSHSICKLLFNQSDCIPE